MSHTDPRGSLMDALSACQQDGRRLYLRQANVKRESPIEVVQLLERSSTAYPGRGLVKCPGLGGTSPVSQNFISDPISK